MGSQRLWSHTVWVPVTPPPHNGSKLINFSELQFPSKMGTVISTLRGNGRGRGSYLTNVTRLASCTILQVGLLFHICFLHFLEWTDGSLPRTYKPCWRGRDPGQEQGSKHSLGKAKARRVLGDLGPKTRKKMAKNLLQDSSPWGTEEILSNNFMPTNVRSWHRVVNWRNVWLSSAGVNICFCPVCRERWEKGEALPLWAESKVRVPGEEAHFAQARALEGGAKGAPGAALSSAKLTFLGLVVISLVSRNSPAQRKAWLL